MREWHAKMLKKRNRLNPDILEASLSFSYAKDFVECGISACSNIEDKISYLEYVMGTIRKELQYDYLSRYFYSNCDRSLQGVVPYHYYNEHGQIVKLSDDGDELIDISPDKTTIISFPRKVSRTTRMLSRIKKKGFKFDPENHLSEYYSQLDICYVTNGFHSTACGVYLNNVAIKSKKCYHVERMYDYVHTDGLNWILSNSNKPYEEVCDFRIALLYEISKIKYDLIKQPL